MKLTNLYRSLSLALMYVVQLGLGIEQLQGVLEKRRSRNKKTGGVAKTNNKAETQKKRPPDGAYTK